MFDIRDRHASLVGVLRQMAAGTVSDTRAWAQQIIDGIDAQTPEGEGVYLAPDGTLMRLEADTCDCGECNTLYRLVSIEGDDRG